MSDLKSLREDRRNIVVIGASTGGVDALQRLAADLPPQFPAAVLIVLHVGANKSLLPSLLAASGPNSAAHAQEGEHLRTGHIVIAPPDHHLLLNEGSVRLTRGPKENFCRPAIDPLFRSAALSYGPRVIGVVLTGALDDGTAGLGAIKACGGVAIVQDPGSAFCPAMPRSAIRYVDVDHCLPIESIGRKLFELVIQESPPPSDVPQEILHEHAPQTGTVNAMDDLKSIAVASTLVCPECGGGLWEIRRAQPPRYRCHTGHAYSLASLDYAMGESSEAALWSAVRVLQERASVKRRTAEMHRNAGEVAEMVACETEAQQEEAQAAHLRELIEKST